MRMEHPNNDELRHARELARRIADTIETTGLSEDAETHLIVALGAYSLAHVPRSARPGLVVNMLAAMVTQALMAGPDEPIEDYAVLRPGPAN